MVSRYRVLVVVLAFTGWSNGTTVALTVDEGTLRQSRGSMQTTAAADLEAVTRGNARYIEAARTASGDIFEEILASDFLCTMPDGTLLDRAAFIARTRSSPPVPDLTAHDVRVRMLGEVAIVHAATSFRNADGSTGRGRYTDVWARRDGRWVAVAAQFLRQ